MQTNEIPWKKVATGLAVFGLVVGAAALFAPGTVAKVTDEPPRKKFLHFFGASEIVAGIAILVARRASPGLWARVAGDALDLGALALSFLSPQASKTRLAISTAAVAGVTALDVVAARRLSRPELLAAVPSDSALH